jgi:hypothetical protein
LQESGSYSINIHTKILAVLNAKGRKIVTGFSSLRVKNIHCTDIPLKLFFI